jgi:predicted O-methyltransferase YrrM
MINQTFTDIYNHQIGIDAIINNEFTGFKEDYLILHCLLRLHNPKSVFEIGTNMGRGTEIICNAVPNATVYSLDLPTELAHISLQHPINEGHGDKVGSLCKRPFKQLRGDSLQFIFKDYPCEAYFIDGEHDRLHVYTETIGAIFCKAKLIIWHDADIPVVMDGILAGLSTSKNYELYRVTDTRIAYAILKPKAKKAK